MNETLLRARDSAAFVAGHLRDAYGHASGPELLVIEDLLHQQETIRQTLDRLIELMSEDMS
mgnify:FL=1